MLLNEPMTAIKWLFSSLQIRKWNRWSFQSQKRFWGSPTWTTMEPVPLRRDGSQEEKEAEGVAGADPWPGPTRWSRRRPRAEGNVQQLGQELWVEQRRTSRAALDAALGTFQDLPGRMWRTRRSRRCRRSWRPKLRSCAKKWSRSNKSRARRRLQQSSGFGAAGEAGVKSEDWVAGHESSWRFRGEERGASGGKTGAQWKRRHLRRARVKGNPAQLLWGARSGWKCLSSVENFYRSGSTELRGQKLRRTNLWGPLRR